MWGGLPQRRPGPSSSDVVVAGSAGSAGTRWDSLAGTSTGSRWFFVKGQEGRGMASQSCFPVSQCVSAQGPMAAVCWARLGSMNPKSGTTAGEGRRENGAAADVSFSVGAPRDAPAGRIITGHSGQGPDLASARVVWLSQSRPHPPEKKKACPPRSRLRALPRVQSRPSLPSTTCRPARPASQPQPVQGLPCPPCALPVPGSLLLWSRPHLAQARACLVSRLVDKDRRAWLVVDIAV